MSKEEGTGGIGWGRKWREGVGRRRGMEGGRGEGGGGREETEGSGS